MPAPNAHVPVVGLLFANEDERELLEQTAEQLRPLYLTAHWVPLDDEPDWKSLANQLETDGVRALVAFGGGSRSPAARLASASPLPVLGLPPIGESTTLSRVKKAMTTSRDRAPVAMLATGRAGARNAALFAAAYLATTDRVVAAALRKFREQQISQVLAATLD